MGLGTRLMLEIMLFSSAPFSMMGKPHFEGKNTLRNTSRKESCSNIQERELQRVSQALGRADFDGATPPTALAFLSSQHLLAPESTALSPGQILLPLTRNLHLVGCRLGSQLKALHLIVVTTGSRH